MNTWRTVSAEEAVQHPLYGIKNWLAVFAFGVLLGPLRELGELTGEAGRAGLTLTQLLAADHPAIAFARSVFVLDSGILVIVYWALFTKSARFRVIASAMLLLWWPATALIAMATSINEAASPLAMALFTWAFSCAIWVTYLNRSKRVRVTFEHQVQERGASLVSTTALLQKDQTAASVSAATQQTDAAAIRTEHHASVRVATSSPKTASTAADEEERWASAFAEFKSDARRPGLWAKSFSEANGNESVAQATYLRVRVSELSAVKDVSTSASAPESEERLGGESIGPPPQTDTWAAETCTEHLVAHGCSVTRLMEGVWEVVLPTQVTVYARSLEALQSVAARF